MKNDVMSRVAALAASVTLAVLATVGVAVSMSSTGDASRTEVAAAAAARAYAGVPVVVLEKTVVVGSLQTLSAWKPPVEATTKQVM